MSHLGSTWVGSLVLIGLCLGESGLAARFEQPPDDGLRQVYRFGPDSGKGSLETRLFSLSPETVFDADAGTIRLARSVLLADETGTTDFHQTEDLGERIQVKKEFVLDDRDVTDPELFLFGSAKQVHVNGQPVPAPERLPSTGWSRTRFAESHLKAGTNSLL